MSYEHIFVICRWWKINFILLCTVLCIVIEEILFLNQFKFIFWKYEGEILCWLLENYVFALAKFKEMARYQRQSILYPI